MKSDHLFAVIIFNKVYIILVAKMKCITKPQTSWLNMFFRNFSACIFYLLRLFETTWPEHFWTEAAPRYYNGFSACFVGLAWGLKVFTNIHTWECEWDRIYFLVYLLVGNFWHEELTLQKWSDKKNIGKAIQTWLI